MLHPRGFGQYAAVEGDGAAGGLGPGLGAERGALAGCAEPIGQGRVGEKALDSRAEAGGILGWDQQAGLAVQYYHAEVADIGRDDWAAEAAGREEQAAGGRGAVRQHDDVGGAEVRCQDGLGEEAEVKGRAVQQAEGGELVLVRGERLVRLAGDDDSGQWAPSGQGAERGDQVGQSLVRLDQAGEEDELGVLGEAELLAGGCALDRRMGFEERAVRHNRNAVSVDAPGCVEGVGAALAVDDHRIGRSVELPVAGRVCGSGVMWHEVVSRVDDRDAEPAQHAPEEQVERWLDGPLDVDDVRGATGDAGDGEQPVERVLGGLERATSGRAVREAEPIGETGACEPEEALVEGDRGGPGQVFVEEARGQQLDAAAGPGKRLDEGTVVRGRVGIRIDHEDVEGAVGGGYDPSIVHVSSSMRVLIVTHHYPPEVGAPQTRLSGTARYLRDRGHDVAVVTAMPSYPTGVIPPAYRDIARLGETIDGIRVERTWTYAGPGGSIRLRLANQLSFTASAMLALPAVGKRDVVLVESPPLFLGMTGAIIGAALGAPTVLHVSDLWPAVAIELGALRDPRAIRAARLFERGVYAASRRLIVVTERWRDQIVRDGVPAEKIDLVTNGVDAGFLDPDAPGVQVAREEIRAELGLAGKTVVACIGTVSYVYGYETILEAAALLASEDPSIHLLIVGDGSQKGSVSEIVAARGLGNVTLLPAQPHTRIRGLLAAADLSASALLPLPVTRGQLPVRILEAMAMARPVAFSGAGVAARLVAESGAGKSVAPGDARALADALAELAADPERRAQHGAAGRATILDRFNRATVAAQIEASLLRATDR